MFLVALALSWQSQIDSLLASPDLRGAAVGVCVLDVRGKVVYEHNADLRLMPASNEKILTAAMALDTLGPDFKWETRFWNEGDRCVVKATGDPTLTASDLTIVAQKLGLKSKTPVVVNAPFGQDYPDGWEEGDLANRYAARPAGFCFDRAGFELDAEGGKLVPLLDALGVNVRYIKGQGDARVSLDLDRHLLTVRGKLPDKRTVLDTFAQPDPIGSACALIGGVYAGRSDTTPDRGPDVALMSRSLSQILPDCLKPSDNHLAEHIFLAAAYRDWELGQRTQPFGYESAGPAMGRFLKGYVNATEDEAHTVDGSGLSRHNLVTAHLLARVLRTVQTKEYAKIFRDSLPKPGDGTLKSRLAGKPVAAKTGSLDEVSSLSGYLWPESASRWTFSIVFNHTLVSSSKVHALQDKIVSTLLEVRKQT